MLSKLTEWVVVSAVNSNQTSSSAVPSQLFGCEEVVAPITVPPTNRAQFESGLTGTGIAFSHSSLAIKVTNALGPAQLLMSSSEQRALT